MISVPSLSFNLNQISPIHTQKKQEFKPNNANKRERIFDDRNVTYIYISDLFHIHVSSIYIYLLCALEADPAAGSGDAGFAAAV